MANKLGQPSDVISGADELMRTLVAEAQGDELGLDKKLAIMQTATRWVAVKNRLNVPDERNGFDEFREQLAGATPARDGPTTAAAPAGSGKRDDKAGSEAALLRRPATGKLNHGARHPSGKTDRGPPRHTGPRPSSANGSASANATGGSGIPH